ncbi:DUF5960 family protein [Enterococcus malodoratus]|uniref:DUF5960 family protein n=1 Tax=Enterococcus malodoratus TaxID=71451 RepID=UPI0039AFEE7B
MTLKPRNVDFYYNPQMTERLTKDFLKVVATDVPFSMIEDELLYLMNERDISCFRIPKSKTRDGLDHVFYFEIFINDDAPESKLYKYIYQKIDRSKKI